MLMAVVTGTLVATRKDEALVGYKLLVVIKENPDGTLRGDPFVAVDTVGAGIGDRVLIAIGSSARVVAEKEQSPIDAAIVGIVDSVEMSTKSVVEGDDS